MQIKEELKESDEIVSARRLQLTTQLERLDNWKGGCGDPFGHKTIVVTADFLKTHGIQYELTIQQAGNVIVTGITIHHQVISWNTNLAEAVNHGSPLW